MNLETDSHVELIIYINTMLCPFKVNSIQLTLTCTLLVIAS